MSRFRNDHRWTSRWGQLLLLLSASSVVYGAGIGRFGLINTEGHRVIPGWTMLETGDWWTPRLFDQAYLRKPPGFAWVVAGSAAIFGASEWSARLIGASAGVGMVLAAYFFARRWFGPTAGLPAGLAQLLTPLFWKYQRSAEIEGLNNLLAQIAILVTIDLLIQPASRQRRGTVVAGMLVLVCSYLLKGPTVLPALLGVVIADCIVQRSWQPFRSKPISAMVLGSGIMVGILVILYRGLLIDRTESIVTQRMFGFEWTTDIVTSALLMIPIAIGQALPTTLLLFVPWLAAPWGDSSAERTRIGRIVSLASVLGVVFYAAIGLTNARYAMPAVTVVPLLAGYLWGQRPRSLEGLARWQRRTRHPAGWGVALACCWVVFVTWMEPAIGNTSGRDEGRRLATMIPNGATLIADTLIEGRPETLYYAQQAARQSGRELHVRWHPQLTENPAFTREHGYFALRTDNGEWSDFCREQPLNELGDGVVYKYPFRVGQSTGGAQQAVSTSATLTHSR